MSSTPRPFGRSAPRRFPLVPLAAVLAGLLLFLVGLAFGRATASDPAGGTQTLVRTLTPLTVTPARETVTVTVTNPG